MFLKFDSQEERRRYGGSCFIELAFCKAPIGTKLEQLVKAYQNWQDDSLYIYNEDHGPFWLSYKDIFGVGILPHLSKACFDIWGITYYTSDQIDPIAERTQKAQPPDYEILLEWLREAKRYNGFYVLGV